MIVHRCTYGGQGPSTLEKNLHEKYFWTPNKPLGFRVSILIRELPIIRILPRISFCLLIQPSSLRSITINSNNKENLMSHPENPSIINKISIFFRHSIKSTHNKPKFIINIPTGHCNVDDAL